MRKFILYTLLLALVVALGTLVFGFWNAKNARNFARGVRAIRTQHDISQEIAETEKVFLSLDKSDSQTIREQADLIGTKLTDAQGKANSALASVKDLESFGYAANLKSDAIEYYEKSAQEADNLTRLAKFVGQAIEASSVFSDIKADANLEDIKSTIALAKEKKAAIRTDELPADVRDPGRMLLDAMGTFLEKMEETATTKAEDTTQLESAFADFSAKEQNFSEALDSYVNNLPDLAPLGQRIDDEISKMEGVYFILK